MTKIREETQDDIKSIRLVNTLAFGRTQEAEIVDKLRRNCGELLSLVATRESEVVGHILFSPATIESTGNSVRGMGLGPLAVRPGHQRQGIGSELARAGISALQSKHCPFIILVGHPGYYPRFGFERASHRGIRSEWQVPDEAFMILVLDETKMRNMAGVAKFRSEFAEAT